MLRDKTSQAFAQGKNIKTGVLIILRTPVRF